MTAWMVDDGLQDTSDDFRLKKPSKHGARNHIALPPGWYRSSTPAAVPTRAADTSLEGYSQFCIRLIRIDVHMIWLVDEPQEAVLERNVVLQGDGKPAVLLTLL